MWQYHLCCHCQAHCLAPISVIKVISTKWQVNMAWHSLAAYNKSVAIFQGRTRVTQILNQIPSNQEPQNYLRRWYEQVLSLLCKVNIGLLGTAVVYNCCPGIITSNTPSFLKWTGLDNKLYATYPIEHRIQNFRTLSFRWVLGENWMKIVLIGQQK